jgi:twitching motility protein PilT
MSTGHPEEHGAHDPSLTKGSHQADHLAGGERKTFGDTSVRKYFEAAVKFEASDLLLRGGQAPKLRIRGVLKGLDVPPLDPHEFDKAIHTALTPQQRKLIGEFGAADLGFDLIMADGSSHRFRLNIFKTRGRSALAARRVTNKILTIEQLHLPAVLNKVCLAPQGLILMAGVTGSGKSTTLASMLQYINENKACHIVTLEDPLEYLFADAKAMISQREIGIDVPNFHEALRSLVRENPDVVLIGEMRDRETFEAALHAAETGHLVFGTIHASSASQAFGRIYELFPMEQRSSIRNMLAFQMQAFVYQKLLPTLREDLQRVPACEILLQSPSVRQYILDAREHELDQVIRENREAGMQTFTDSLVYLVQNNYVSPKVAQAAATNPEEVKMRIKGMVGR